MKLFRTGILLAMLITAIGVTRAQEPPGPDRGLPADFPVSPIKAEVAGYIRIGKDRRGVEALSVRLETTTGAFIAQTRTNRAGHFVFPSVGCGYFVIAVDAPGYRPVRELVEHSYVSTETVLHLIPADGTSPAAEAAVSLQQLQIPADARSEYEKGLVALSKQKTEQGITRFRRAIELYPGFDAAYLQLSLVYLSQGAHGEAQEVIESAIAANPANARAYALLGVTHREQRKLPEAVEAFNRSLSLEEGSWFSHLELGETLVRMGKVEEAAPHVARAHELNPATSSVHLLLYKTLILRSDYTRALAELEEFLELFPDHPVAPRAREKRDALRKSLSPSGN